MKLCMSGVLAASLLAVVGCHSTTVRGTDGQSLTATTPRSMTIRRGESATLEVGIDRERMTGPVSVSLFQLPEGVESDQTSIRAETTSATFILTAAKGASLVRNQAVGVTTEGPDGRQTTQYITLTVTD